MTPGGIILRGKGAFMKKLYSNKLIIFSLVLPGLLVFIFAILAPICLSVYYGFTDYSGMGQATFIGMENYKTLLHDKSFGRALLNSLLLAIGFICIQHPIAIVVAAVLDKLSGKAEGFFRCVYFIPNVISVAVIAYLWKFIYNPDFGLLNNVLKVFGYQGKINWFSADNAIWSVLIVLIWHGFGWGMLIYYTGIKNIDPRGRLEDDLPSDHAPVDEAGDSDQCHDGNYLRLKADGDGVSADKRRTGGRDTVCGKLSVSAGV